MSKNKTKAELLADLEQAQKRVAELEAENAYADEERFAAVFRASPSQMALTDLTTHTYVEVNEAFLQSLGFTREEVIGKSVPELNLFADPAQRNDVLQRMAAQGYLRNEHILVRTNSGELRDGMFSAEYIQANGQKLLLTVMNDVTEKMQAEAKYRLLVEQSPAIVYEDEIGGPWHYLSPQLTKITGYTPEEFIQTRGLWKSIIYPEDLPRLEQETQLGIEQESRISLEYRIIARDGRVVWFHDEADVFVDAQTGKIILRGLFQDITDRKQMEEKLRESEERFRTFIEQSSDGFMLTDEQGVIIEWNRAIANITEVLPEQTLGRAIWDVQPELAAPENHLTRERSHSVLLGMLQTGRSPLLGRLDDSRIVTRSGIRKFIQQTAFPIHTTEGYRLGVVFRDVTERRLAEEDLLKSRNQLTLALTAARMGSWHYHLPTNRVEWSPETGDIFNIDIDQNDFSSVLAQVHPEDRLKVAASLQDVLRRGKFVDMEFRMLSAGGRTIWVTNYGNIEFDTDGTPIAISGLIQDITERKLNEERVHESERNLQSFLNNSPDTIYVLDLTNHTSRFLNREEFLGYTREELESNHSILAAVHPDDISGLQEQWSRLLTLGRNENAMMHYRIKSKAGNWEWIQQRSGVLAFEQDRSPQKLLITLSVITQRKEAEAALQESEERHRLITSLMSDYVYAGRIDKTGAVNTDWISGAFEQITGYTVEEMVALPGGFVHLVISDDLQSVMEQQHRLWAGETLEAEYRIRRRDGEIRWLHDYMRPIREGSDPSSLHLMGAVKDITEWKNAQDLLHQSEARYRALVEQIPAIVYRDAIDETSSALYISPQVERLLGYSPEEWIADPRMWINLIHPNDRERVLAEHARTNTADGPFRVEYRLIARNGNAVCVRDEALIMRDGSGKPLYWQGFLLDITERKLAEEARRESDERYHLLFENMVQGVVFQDHTGRIIQANPAAERILGLTFDQMQERTSVDLRWQSIDEDGSPFPGEEHPAMLALRTGKPIQNVVMGVFNPVENAYRWININATPRFLKGSGKPYQVYTTFEDITERKQTENALRKSEKRLRSFLTISQTMSTSIASNSILQTIVDNATQSVELDSGAIYMLNGNNLFLAATTPALPPGLPDELRHAALADHPHIQAAVSMGSVVILPDTTTADLTQTERLVTEARGLRSVVYLPLMISKKVIGVLIVGSVNEPYEFSAEEVVLYEGFAGQAAQTMENVRLYGSVREYAAELETQIVERKQAEEKLRESETKYQDLFNSTNDSIWVIDYDTTILDVNRAASSMLGYSREELLSMKIPDIDAGLDADTIQKLAASMPTDKFQVFETKHLKKDGRKIPVEVSSSLVSFMGKTVIMSIARDSTERKQSEEKLRTSEERYRSLFEANPVAIWEDDFSEIKKYIQALKRNGIQDLEWYLRSHQDEILTLFGLIRVIDVNQAALNLYEAKNKAQLMFGIPKTVPPDKMDMFLPQFKEQLLSLARGDLHYQVETTRQTLQGKIRYVQLIWSVAPGYEETLERVLVSILDITEIKQAQEALRRSNDTAQAIFNAATETVFLMDTSGTVLAANETAAARLGKSVSELVGANIYDSIPNDVGEARRKQLQRVTTERSPIIFEDERFGIWMENSIYPIFDNDGEIRQVAIYGRDITERKQTEEVLWQNQLRMELAITAANAATWDWNVQAGRLVVNERWASMLGYSLQELEPISIQTWEHLCHPDDLKLYNEQLQKHFAGEVERCEHEMRMKHKNGSWVWLFDSGKVMEWDKEGRPLRMFGTHLDITERKMQERLTQARLRLANISHESVDMESLMRTMLDEAETLTESSIGFFHFVDDDQNTISLQTWSTNTLNTMCTAEGKGQHYPLEQAGVWADGIRDGRPRIYNDYEKVPTRRALPTGHAPVTRLISLPVMRNNQVVAAMGIGNKPRDYDERDLEILQHLADDAFDIILRKRAEHALRESERKLSTLLSNLIGFAYRCNNDRAWTMQYISNGCETITGYSPNDLTNNHRLAYNDLIHPADQGYVWTTIQDALEKRSPYQLEYRITTRQGAERWVWEQGRGVFEGEKLQALEGFITDVNDRKHAEQALRDSEEKYRGLLESLDSVIAMIDPKGRFLYLNDSGSAVFGGTSQTMIGKTMAELFPKPFADHQVSVIQSVVESNQGKVVEELSYAHGQPRWYRTSVQPLHDDTGQVTSVLVNATDIHELKIMQQELQELNRSLEARVTERTAQVQDLYDNAPVGYHSINRDREFTAINQTELKMLGYSGDELLGRHTSTIFTPDSEPILAKNFQRLVKEGRVENMQVMAKRKDGSTFPVMVNATAIYDEHGNYVTSRSTLIDITERKRAEDELKRNVNFINALLDSIPTPVFQKDNEGRYQGCNRAFTEIMGKTQEEIRGKTTHELWPSQDADIYHQKDLQLMQSRQRQVYEATVTDSVGNIRPVIFVKNIFFDESGNVAGLVGTFLDITERKRAEEDLQNAIFELERALRVKDEFLANMSHELRTPLNAIIGLAESLADQIAGDLNDKQQKYVNTIRESGQHLLTLINDILDLSKIEAGQVELDRRTVSVRTACDASLRMIKQLATKKQLNVSFEMDEQIHSIEADERRLKQMLVNLLTNAVKFTPERGEIGLTVLADPEQQKIRFIIWDQGIGIKAEDQPRLFKPFVQINNILNNPLGGTGLGLALVAQLAHLHHGEVELQSEFGKGSRFTLTLPWNEAPEVAAQDGTGALQRRPDPKVEPQRTILLVEDTETAILVIEDYLVFSGYHVVVAHNGKDGVDLANQVKPDLILMDIQMPGIDGLEATRILRSQAEFKTTPIIALTAFAMSGDRERFLATGLSDYISKPVNLKNLISVIQMHLGTDQNKR